MYYCISNWIRDATFLLNSNNKQKFRIKATNLNVACFKRLNHFTNIRTIDY